MKNYDEAIEKYIPVLMALCKILWDNLEYEEVEKTLKMCQDYCSINDHWRINMGHVCFVQEKYSDAITYYSTLYNKNKDDALILPAIVLANLAVSYIM